MCTPFTRPIALLFGSVLAGTLHSQQNALDFDGVDDAVVISAASQMIESTPGISLTCWVYPANAAPAFPDLDAFAGLRNENDCDFYLLQIGPANTVEGRFRGTGGLPYTVSAPSLQLNAWQHLALVYDGFTLTLYHNGLNVSSVSAGGQIFNSGVAMFIGDLVYLTNNFYLKGKVDEVALWSVALTPAELACIVGEGIDTGANGLELFYKFDQGTAGGNNTSILLADDEMGNLDGALVGFALTGSTSNFVQGPGYGFQSAASICPGDSYQFGTQTLTSPGVYTETFNTGGPCDSTVTLTLSFVSVNTGVVQTGNTLTALAPVGPYQWLDCNNGFAEIPGEDDQDFTPSGNGSYAVVITQGNCTDTSACYTITGIGMNEQFTAVIGLHPVPAQDVLVIEVPSVLEGSEFRITDLEGRHRLLARPATGLTVQLDVSSLARGSYLLDIRNARAHVVRRFVKE